ncbi:MAG TPA: hypothetical protein VH640_21620 [Bryobacteraceae bacterium]
MPKALANYYDAIRYVRELAREKAPIQKPACATFTSWRCIDPRRKLPDAMPTHPVAFAPRPAVTRFPLRRLDATLQE